MIGHIESFDPDRQTGVIKSDDRYYEFHIDDWTSPGAPEAGDDVKFEQEDDKVKVVALVGAYLDPTRPVKSKWVATLLALFLGGIGAHRFYLGFYGIGFAQIALTVLTVGYGVVWGVIEFFLLLTNNINKDAQGRPLK